MRKGRMTLAVVLSALLLAVSSLYLLYTVVDGVFDIQVPIFEGTPKKKD